MPEGRQERENDDPDDNRQQILIDFVLGQNLAEEIAEECQADDPHERARHRIEHEFFIIHLRNAREERNERADDRHETRADNRHCAVPLIKTLGHREVLALQEAR